MLVSTLAEVHPRLRGELTGTKFPPEIPDGSSPLTRGTPVLSDKLSIAERFIPAYAGNSVNRSIVVKDNPVHPRLRGELSSVKCFCIFINGSSPLTRGTHAIIFDLPPLKRFIPAYAGNSALNLMSYSSWSVHPRLRGELFFTFFQLLQITRFIPAYAGNSPGPKLVPSFASGSSPLTRGTPVSKFGFIVQPRFIPAYAGNSNSNLTKIVR